MPLTIEITRDPELLSQYYELREEYFRKDLGIPDFDGEEEHQDQQGRILIAHQDGKCIIGARICSGLPMSKQLREFGLSARDSCLWERFVMHPSARKLTLARDFSSALIDVSRNLGYRHALVLSTLRISKLYRLCHTSFGVEFNIQRAAPECAQGAFAELDHYISIATLHQDQAQQQLEETLQADQDIPLRRIVAA